MALRIEFHKVGHRPISDQFDWARHGPQTLTELRQDFRFKRWIGYGLGEHATFYFAREESLLQLPEDRPLSELLTSRTLTVHQILRSRVGMNNA
jgi:hypothetical protein